jgi:hypothetical protein
VTALLLAYFKYPRSAKVPGTSLAPPKKHDCRLLESLL